VSFQVALARDPPNVDFALDFGQVQFESVVEPVTCEWHLNQINQLVAEANELGLPETEKWRKINYVFAYFIASRIYKKLSSTNRTDQRAYTFNFRLIMTLIFTKNMLKNININLFLFFLP